MKSCAVKTFQTHKSRKMSVMQCQKPIPHLQHATVLVLLTPPTFYRLACVCARVRTHTHTHGNRKDHRTTQKHHRYPLNTIIINKLPS